MLSVSPYATKHKRASFAHTQQTQQDEELDDFDDETIKIDTILPSLLEQLDASADVETLRDIVEGVERLDALRHKQQLDAFDVIKKLSRELEATKCAVEDAKQESNRIKDETNVKIAALERQKLMIGKAIHEEEKSLASLEARKRELLAQLEELKANEEKEAARPPDESVLKLSIYQNLGIDLVYENDKIVRCLVRSATKNDINPLEMTDTKYSNYFYANVLWSMCS
ncbi:UNVERIFIED_CONTAM: hypothetical protein HDU68_000335 [Siphonaria sp. JEL0065]|nr:hypothetical protein HDU68_000335 [Siphonaria sp. JEL0065]